MLKYLQMKCHDISNLSSSGLAKNVCVYVCACVCVFVERERESERGKMLTIVVSR